MVYFGIIRLFHILLYLKFCQFSYFSFDMNKSIFSIFISYSSDSPKFARTTFERLLIFKFGMSF